MDRDNVIETIERAFPLEPLPSMTLHQAQLADDSLTREITEEEWVAAGKPDVGRSWKEFADDEIIACDASQSHFDEEAFVYYLPAFMVFALRHHDVDSLHPASSQVGGALFSLTHRSAYSLARYKKLTAQQREAVIAFLEFMAVHANPFRAGEAQKALKRYWKTDEAAKPLIVIP